MVTMVLAFGCLCVKVPAVGISTPTFAAEQCHSYQKEVCSYCSEYMKSYIIKIFI